MAGKGELCVPLGILCCPLNMLRAKSVDDDSYRRDISRAPSRVICLRISDKLKFTHTYTHIAIGPHLACCATTG